MMKLLATVSIFVLTTSYLILNVNGEVFNEETPERSIGDQNRIRTKILITDFYDSCLSTNTREFNVEKIETNKTIYIKDNNCNHIDSTIAAFNYTLIVNGVKKLSTVYYNSHRCIWVNGTLNLFNCGRVEHGFWNGAYVSEVGFFPNPMPNACHSKIGLTFLKSIYLTINFEKSKGNRFSCSGYSTNTNSPGLVIK